MNCGRLLALIATILFPFAGWAATTSVTVGPGLAFNPSSVSIAPGDTVQWTWVGAFHTSTSNATSGPEFWDSGVMATGTFSHTFSTVGDWPYYCFLHSSPTGTAMNGIVHVVAATPTLTGVNPTSGPPAGGTVVTLTGTNFASGCTASFGTTPAASTTVSDSATIFATTPAHAAGVVDVSVACPGGGATLPAAFTFAFATPTLTGVNPTSGPPAGGTVVTLTGTNFASGCSASFGTTLAASTTVSDSATIFATTPAHTAGVVDVSVACPAGSATLAAAFTFVLAPAAPVGGPALSGRGLLILATALAMAGAFALRTPGV